MRNFILTKKESALLRKGETITKTRGNYCYVITPTEDGPHLEISLKEDVKVVIRDSKTITFHFDVVNKAKKGEQATQSVDGETLVLHKAEDGTLAVGVVNDYQVITQ